MLQIGTRITDLTQRRRGVEIGRVGGVMAGDSLADYAAGGTNPGLVLDFAGVGPNAGGAPYYHDGTAESDFASLLTFTRASGGTYFDAAGVLQLAAVNVPRIDHDPATGANRGLLMESGRTNLVPWSKSVQVYPLNAATFDIDATVAPDGLTGAEKVKIPNTLNVRRGIGALISTAANVQRTISCFVKAGEFTTGILFAEHPTSSVVGGYTSFDLVAKTATGGRIQELANGWFRVWHSLTAPAWATRTWTYQVRLGSWEVGTGRTTGDGMFMWGFSVETGMGVTSYIHTSGAATTRAADDILMAAGSEYPYSIVTGHSLFAEFDAASLPATRLLSLTDGTDTDKVLLIPVGASLRAFVSAAGTSQFDATLAGLNITGLNKASIALGADGIIYHSLNGAVSPFLASKVMPSLPLTFRLSRDHAAATDGTLHWRLIRAFNTRFTTSTHGAETA